MAQVSTRSRRPTSTATTRAVNGREALYRRASRSSRSAAEGCFRRLKWSSWRSRSASTTSRRGSAGTAARYAPDQAVLVDLANRRFYFFFIEIWPQEFYYVAGLLIMAGLGLFLVTSVARPRLVRLCLPADGLDRPLHLGRAPDRGRPQRPHPARRGAVERRQDRQARPQVYAVWLLIAVATGGAWIFYFADAPTLLRELVTGEAPTGRLHHRRHPDRHHLRLRRLHARAGLHLHVPLAAHPGRHARRGVAHRHLQ